MFFYIRIKRRSNCELINWKHFLDEMRGRIDDNTFNKRLKEIVSRDVLFIDDIATEDCTPWANELLYSVIDPRYNENKETYFSSNNHGDELHERVGDRNYRRIIEMAPEEEVEHI